MILVDASVLIDALKGKDPKIANLFATLPVAICGVTLAEVLHGARDPGHYRNLENALSKFPWVAVDDSIWKPLANHLFLLRTNGITVPFQDVFLATVGIVNDLEVWARDKQFPLIQTVLPALKLFVEPP